jgi:hypothetical protein
MRTFAFGLALVALAGCSNKEDGTAKAAASASAVAPAAIPLNATLVGHVKAHAEKCTVSVEQGQAYGCKDNVTDAMSKYVRETKPDDFSATLIALVRKTDDPKTSAAAVALLAEQFDYLGDAAKRKNATPAVVKDALAMLKENTGNRGARLAAAATHLATIGGAFDELYAIADAHPSKEARANVYRHLLVFGRLKGLPKLRAVAEKTPDLATAALDAVPRLGISTDEEKSMACPWAETYLGNADADVATQAGQAMVYCKGQYIDALVAEADKRLKNKQFKNPFAMVMREPCFEFISDITKKAANEKQCDAVYTFLEKVVNDSSVDDATRSLALFNIYYQRRDDKTLKLMRKYENHPNKEIAKRAKETIATLTTTYKLKG